MTCGRLLRFLTRNGAGGAPEMAPTELAVMNLHMIHDADNVAASAGPPPLPSLPY